MSKGTFESTKVLELGSAAFRQWRAACYIRQGETKGSHCSVLHGYDLKAKFWFRCNELDERGWVVDFGDLKVPEKALKRLFDHKLCIAADDPAMDEFRALEQVGACELSVFEKGVGIERFVELAFNHVNEYVRNLTNNRCWVHKVEIWEHDKNSATYENE